MHGPMYIKYLVTLFCLLKLAVGDHVRNILLVVLEWVGENYYEAYSESKYHFAVKKID